MIEEKNCLKILPIVILIILNSTFAIAETTKWDDFTKPLKVNFEIPGSYTENIEVFLPEAIIEKNEKIPLYFEIECYGCFDYAIPFVKVNDSNWAKYSINKSKIVFIKKKHLRAGLNKFTVSNQSMITTPTKISEIRFELGTIKGLENKFIEKLSNSQSISLSKNENNKDIIRWSDVKIPLIEKFEIRAVHPKVVEVSIPEFIIKTFDEVSLYIDYDIKNIDYVSPYVQINDNVWARYLIKESKIVKINTKDLIAGVNKLIFAFKNSVSWKGYINEVKFELEKNISGGNTRANIEANKPKDSKNNISESKHKVENKVDNQFDQNDIKSGYTCMFGFIGVGSNSEITLFTWNTKVEDFKNNDIKGFSSQANNDEYLENAESYIINKEGTIGGEYTEVYFHRNRLYALNIWFKYSLEELINVNDMKLNDDIDLKRDRELFKELTSVYELEIDEHGAIWRDSNNANYVELFTPSNNDNKYKSVLYAANRSTQRDYEYRYKIAKEKAEEEEIKRVEFNSNEQQARANVKQDSIKVKGLYIGMYYKDAISIIENIFGNKVNIDTTDGNSANIHSVASIEWDNIGHIISISVNDTDTFFGMNREKTKYFVKNFCDSYKIPTMEYYTISNPYFGTYTGYKYESPKGFEVSITDTFFYEGMTMKNLNHLKIFKIAEKQSGTFN